MTGIAVLNRLTLTAAAEPTRLKAPFRIAGHVFDSFPTMLVNLDDGEVTGRGEASGVYYLGDDVDHMLAEVSRYREAIESGIDRATLRGLMPPGGARNAVDCALWELESKRSGRPVWQLAGLAPPRRLVTTFTIGADDPDAVRAAMAGLHAASAIKVKLEGWLDADVERVRLVRHLRPGAWLMADANQGYDVNALEALMPVLVEARVALLEQPVRRGREAELGGYRSPVPLAADESVQELADLPALIGRFQVANIKLDKCGGLTEALLMEREARRLGLGVMVGNMAGTSLAAAPGFLLGQRCDVVDLDGPTFIEKDRSAAVCYANGRISCPDRVWGGGC